ncbi:bifunctional serine/threonine-protein kinase/formylglycine-generating enzyme family protein [Marinicella litoralis]|uniref:bifunctional serine/threonine-protein kinase/formylglycine-generating enzyme family protein n=1 Tax=Marinicella litoralis TaxID=644220 RepID=UPI0015D482AF|nr:bifunctional serine/threonine-protein kinase/formylglycine-generating enzyme family protein [Marinicella litoralis]
MKTVPKLNLSIPDHTILDKIGEGGMSAVYLGRQISLQRKVAIKVLKKLVMDDKTLSERFVDEAKTVASLDHPHIISIYEAKKLPSGLAYFTMPYLTHGDFGEIICTNSDHLIELLCQICDGLSHAHKHGVIHRDLKPENILFDQFGRIKIADFGIAISKNIKRKTKDTQLLGSAHFMSPEQIQSKMIDFHTDIYSLGCIIYEKLTGDHVFDAGNDFSILMSHINKPIPTLPKALSEWQPIIDTCLAKDPEDRYQSVEEVKDALLEIKYSKSSNEKIGQSKNPSLSQLSPAKLVIAAGVILTLLVTTAWLFMGSDTDIIEPATTATTIEPTEPVEAADQDPEPAAQQPLVSNETPDNDPLTLTFGVIEADPELDEDAELIDLTGNLDNDQINEMSIEVTLNEAQQLLSKYRLTKPKGENAADKFQKILLEHPDHAEAQTGLNQVGVYYFRLINSKLKKEDTTAALKHIQSVVSYIETYQIDRGLFDKQVSAIMSATDQKVKQAIQQRRRNPATENYLKMAKLLVPDAPVINNLQSNYDNIPIKGDVSTDTLGHQFVFIPVYNPTTMNDLLVSQSEVTVAQFESFAGDKFTEEKCSHYGKKSFFKKTWAKPPFDQTSNHPVVCVSFNHAKAYATWLSAKTGDTYRLPTAQEWQYINQQVRPTHHCQSANVAGAEVEDESKATDNPLTCHDGFTFTAPINSFAAKININDYNGNVAEWVSNCNGNKGCVAGTSWRSGQGVDPLKLDPLPTNETYSHVGFRLVKEIQ